jgi:hypothetical protein
MRSKEAFETEYFSRRWDDISKGLYRELLHKLVNNNIVTNYIFVTNYSFFTVVLYKQFSLDKVKDLVMELEYNPKIVNEYTLTGYYYFSILFNIEE